MKKLNKLQINSEKIMKNEELSILRGGYTWHCDVTCTDYTEYQFGFSVAYPEEWFAEMGCIAFFAQEFENCSCNC